MAARRPRGPRAGSLLRSGASISRAQRDAKRFGDLAERPAQVVVKHEDGALLGRQSPESAVERVARRDAQGRVGCRQHVDRQHPNVGGPTSRPLCFRIAGVDENPVDPGFEAIDLTKLRKLPPGRDEGLLHGVLGPPDVAQDPMRNGEKPISRAAGDRGERLFVP